MDRKMILNIPLITREQDFWTWHYEKSGIFFPVRSAYRMLVFVHNRE